MIKVNKEQQLYVIPCGNGYSCLGFDVVVSRTSKLAAELGVATKKLKKGSKGAYKEYTRVLSLAKKRHEDTGWRSKIDLIPEFIGKEGERVEVITSYGEKLRYYIGKSTGFIPCHLEILKSNSSGGGPVCGYPFKSVSFLGKFR